ncbi:hypothetical protein HU200_067533 [Digitaria exilis]|uniref:RING-type domain-containing protein n=1 Tax=Digitaria exilis TaxID=1010633 RepID=A0A834ZUM8_9POAL|nr:hypothetical protein HU200_067533 [Digitaria exilis]
MYYDARFLLQPTMAASSIIVPAAAAQHRSFENAVLQHKLDETMRVLLEQGRHALAQRVLLFLHQRHLHDAMRLLLPNQNDDEPRGGADTAEFHARLDDNVHMMLDLDDDDDDPETFHVFRVLVLMSARETAGFRDYGQPEHYSSFDGNNNNGGFGVVTAAPAAVLAGLEKRTFHTAGENGGGGADVMPCPSRRHQFHPGCIAMWLGVSDMCPLCRHVLVSCAPVASTMVAAEPERADDQVIEQESVVARPDGSMAVDGRRSTTRQPSSPAIPAPKVVDLLASPTMAEEEATTEHALAVSSAKSFCKPSSRPITQPPRLSFFISSPAGPTSSLPLLVADEWTPHVILSLSRSDQPTPFSLPLSLSGAWTPPVSTSFFLSDLAPPPILLGAHAKDSLSRPIYAPPSPCKSRLCRRFAAMTPLGVPPSEAASIPSISVANRLPEHRRRTELRSTTTSVRFRSEKLIVTLAELPSAMARRRSPPSLKPCPQLPKRVSLCLLFLQTNRGEKRSTLAPSPAISDEAPSRNRAAPPPAVPLRRNPEHRHQFDEAMHVLVEQGHHVLVQRVFLFLEQRQLHDTMRLLNNVGDGEHRGGGVSRANTAALGEFHARLADEVGALLDAGCSERDTFHVFPEMVLMAARETAGLRLRDDEEPEPYPYGNGGFGAVPAPAAAVDGLEKRTFHAGEVGGGVTECSICFEDFVDGGEVSVMPCPSLRVHQFHPDCIAMWLGISNMCPLCRHVPITC